VISGGKATGKSGGSFDALKTRLAQGKGGIFKGAAKSRAAKTSWNKTGKNTFAVKK